LGAVSAWPDAVESIQALAEGALSALDKGDHELSILLTDDPHIQEMNASYRDKEQPTDVLSFSQDEGETFVMPVPILGDLVISLETAQRQADERNHPVAAEWRILLVHGLLHLLGHDHIGSIERTEMAQAENSLLAALPSHPDWPTTSGLIVLQGGT
jgi:probable rRNA maturation factor